MGDADGRAKRDTAPTRSQSRPEETASGVKTAALRGERRVSENNKSDSDPPSFRPLTPYQARMDVEMDDTAISRVRDPSASITIGPEGGIIDFSRVRTRVAKVFSASSVAFGATFGIVLVVVLFAILEFWSP